MFLASYWANFVQLKIRAAQDAPILGLVPDLDVIVYGEAKLRGLIKELDRIIQN